MKADRDGEILLEVSDAVRETLIRSMDSEELVAAAEQLEADLDTIKREVRRHRNEFVTLSDGRIGLHLKVITAAG